MTTGENKIISRRDRQRKFHLDRIARAVGDIEKLEIAFGLLRSDLLNTSDVHKAHEIAQDVLDHMLTKSIEIPRNLT